MAWVFSKRCKQALKDKKIKVSIPLTVRNRILKVMNIYNECVHSYFDPNIGMDIDKIFALDMLPEKIKEEIGCKDLFAFPEGGDGPAVPSNLEGFILRGNYHPYLLDTL